MKLNEVLTEQTVDLKQIKQWLLKHKIYKHRIEPNGVVHVQGRVEIVDDFERLPVR